MFFELWEITGFCCYDKRILINDDKGKPFYFYKNPHGKAINFNLPKGGYETENSIFEIPNPVKYALPKLPPANISRRLPDKIEIRIAHNPNKCTVLFEGGKMLVIMDEQFRGYPKPFLIYILFHEVGHLFYTKRGTSKREIIQAEINCDLFAQREMLKRGYNPSQTYLSNEITISGKDFWKDRKKHCYRVTQKINSYGH